MRKSGAFSTVLAMGRMATLALRARVAMVPVKPSPSRVNVPMVVIKVSLRLEAAHCGLACAPKGAAGRGRITAGEREFCSVAVARNATQGKILVEPDTQGSRLAHTDEDVLGRVQRKGVTFARGFTSRRWRTPSLSHQDISCNSVQTVTAS